jgi:hypothetical protein
MDLVLRSSIQCPRWPSRVFLGGIEEEDRALRSRARRHGYLLDYRP